MYIVECNDGTYYTGYTPDLERRVKLHNAGRGAKYTKYRRPVKLIWHKEYRYFKHAFLEEKRIKGLTRPEKDKLVKEAACQPKVFVKTFGCQMNVKDSETILGMLRGNGYALADSPEKSDVILFNTCSVRAHAEERAINNVAALRALKEQTPKIIIGIVGCMAKAKGKELFKKLPHLDFISGPANIYDIPDIIGKIVKNRNGSPLRLAAINNKRRDVRHDMRGAMYAVQKSPCALLNITEGCDNYCSYCVVPYARGHEVSRPIRDILKEAKCLIASGVKDITLLGQNVNSYKPSFAKLLEAIDKIAGDCRIRFMTNHPKDASEELFRAMRDLKSVCEHIHLPVQSGSDKILKRMNRRYTRAHYLKLVESLRRYVPDCAVTTDIIVGFPGETDSDFKKTQDIMRKADFDSSFIFKYSPRPLTKASRLKDDVPKKVKEERNQALLELQRQLSLKKNEALIGKTIEVLSEGEAKKGAGLFGSTRANKSVIFSGKKNMIGKFVNVKIKRATPSTLIGETLKG